MAHYYSFKKTPHLPSLQELCTQVLIDNKHALGDVGDIPSTLLKPVLTHCSPEQLQRIEDQTMDRSGRDLRWDTWQIWKQHYICKYGKPNPDEVPELKAYSNGEVDPDNLPEDVGDYRTLYEYKLRRTESQRVKLVEKLRTMKKKEQLSKERTKAIRVDTIAVKKRLSTKTKGVHQNGKSNPGMSRQDFLQRLGISPKSRTIVKRR